MVENSVRSHKRGATQELQALRQKEHAPTPPKALQDWSAMLGRVFSFQRDVTLFALCKAIEREIRKF